jgi:uncharacterized iron-regulated membrane protein
MGWSLRAFLRQLHLWLGLSLGLLFAVLALSGAALVFYVEIDAALHREVASDPALPAPHWEDPVWDRVQATARRYSSDPHGEWSFEATGQGGAIPARYYPSSHAAGHHAERDMVWFAADGSRILRSEPWGGYLMSWLYELHMHLLAGDSGRQIVGWSGCASLLLLLSGLLLWWPRGSWRKALAFKRAAAPIRRLRDLHKLAGLWSLVLLLLLTATGALLALPELKQALFTAVAAAPEAVPAPRSSAQAGRQIPLSQALAAARRVLPEARLAFVDMPGAGDKPFRVRVQLPGDPHRRFPGSFVFVDQYSGEVLAVHDVRQGNGASAINSWIRPLHDGSIGGLWGRCLALLLGCVPLFLFVTGLLFWRRRLRARMTSSTRSPA